MRRTRFCIFLLMVLALSGCKLMESFTKKENIFGLTDAQMESIKQKHAVHKAFAEKQLAAAGSYETLIDYLTASAHRIEAMQWSASRPDAWQMEIDPALIKFGDNFAEPLAKELGLERVPNPFQEIAPSLAGKPNPWAAFINSKITASAIVDCDPTLSKDGCARALNDSIIKQRGTLYTFQTAWSNVIEIGGLPTKNCLVFELTPEWQKRFHKAKGKASLALHKRYASAFLRAYGNPTLMRAPLEFFLNFDRPEYLRSIDLDENGQIPSYQYSTTTRRKVLGVVSCSLKGNGICESVVRVEEGDFQSKTYTLMVRTQIAPDGTPLFMEYFSL